MAKQAKPLIVIAGPTASGKTALAVELAKKFDGEIVNADSRSIYRGMDIGTAKPTTQEMDGVPHHLLDIASPDETFSVARFKELANSAIKNIWERNKIPFIVGGTGLYIDSVVYDYQIPESPHDDSVRKVLEKKTAGELHIELAKIDRESAEKIGLNKRRLVRALEIFMITGKSKSEQESKKSLPENVLYLAIDMPRETLYSRINSRVDAILEAGFLDEIKDLLSKYPANSPAMNGIGYKHFAKYLSGEITLDEATEKFKQGDRNLAKRQLTWLRRNPDIQWVHSAKEAEDAIASFIE